MFFLLLVCWLLPWISPLYIFFLLVLATRLYVVYSGIEEEDVQVSVWPVCMDTYDSDCGIHSVILYCGQYLWRNFLVTFLSETPLLPECTYTQMFTYICTHSRRKKKMFCNFNWELLLWLYSLSPPPPTLLLLAYQKTYFFFSGFFFQHHLLSSMTSLLISLVSSLEKPH